MSPLERKLGKKSKKALTYMRRMISTSNWKPNEKIPTISSIASSLNMSAPSVRKALRILEHEKTIQSYDSLGFFVLSDALVKRYKLSRTSMLVHMASVHIDAAKMAHMKLKLFGQYGISYNPDTAEVYAHNIVSHKSMRTTWAELYETITSPVTVKQMLETEDRDELNRLKKKYRRQNRLSRLARVVNLNQKKLGITNG